MRSILLSLIVVFEILALVVCNQQPPVQLLEPRDGAVITSAPIKVEFALKKPGVRSKISVDGFAVAYVDETRTQAHASVELPYLRDGKHVLRVDVLSNKNGEVLGPHAEVEINVQLPWEKPEREPDIPTNRNEDGEEIETELKGGHVIMHEKMMNFVHADSILECGGVNWTARTNKIRVFDAFMFFNELDVLEVRLNTLDPYVDVFVLCEATTTHQGGKKPMYYLENKERFAKFAHKIRHLVVDDLPHDHPDSWVIENYHRNSLTRALVDLGPEDLVIVSDVDEIPRPDVLASFVECDGYGTPAFLYSRFFNFRFEYEFAGPWTHGPRIARGKDMEPLGYVTPQGLRTLRMRNRHTKLEEAGWHVSFFSDVDGILTKMDAFAHAEFRTEKWKNREKIKEALDKGIDYFNENDEPRVGGMLKNMDCEGLPQYVLDNPQKFASWIPHCTALEQKLS